MPNHNLFMQRCLELASNALGNTYPNPIVGSVITYNNQIIGEGFHLKAGQPHAEVMAINSVKNKKLLKKATLYVNLEPCSHFGKTPPCADLIASLKIPNVIIGTIDTSAKVSGKGIAKLKNAGINVVLDVLKPDSRWINKRFFTFHEKHRPYIILKWAQSADGFMDYNRQNRSQRQSIPISSLKARTLVHKWRAQENAIVVGTNTVLNDNPQLTVRLFKGNNPIRICFDFYNKIPKTSKIFDNSSKTFCLTDPKYKSLDNFMKFLFEQNIQSIIVEGGATLLNAFIKQNLWDEARIFIAKKLILSGLKAPAISGKTIKTIDFDNETLFIIVNHEKNSYYSDNITTDNLLLGTI